MKPLLIFQLPRRVSDPEMRQLMRTIEKGIENGALIIDSSVTVISFDQEGNMDYCTQQEVEVRSV